jgi:hypothetical protein
LNNKKILCSTTSLSKELFSVEVILKELHSAVMGLKAPGLDKAKIARLWGKIASCKVYKELLVDEFAAILDWGMAKIVAFNF